MRCLKTVLTRITMTSTLLATSLIACADDLPKFNMTPGVTPVSHKIYDLHMLMFWIVTVIAIFTFGFLFFSVFKYRKSKGAVSSKVDGNHKLEIAWTIVPFLILVLMAIPATKVLIELNDTRDAEMTIKITGYQWYWQYEYLDNGIAFFSRLSTPQAQINNQELKGQWYLLEVDKPLVIPTHKKVRFLVTSNDVIHSWWVPALGVKRDAVPGFINELWAEVEKPGTYRGQCAELCGAQHGFMPIVVEAKDQKDFDAWLAQNKKQAELES
jgi:cytochrome c oxidase subunit 2